MGISTDTKHLLYRRTKIVATLGPSSADADTIAALIDAGADVFRLNMSHGTHDGHRQVYRRVREATENAGKPVAVLADLCGPKIRIGTFPGGRITLEKGATVTVTTRETEGKPGLIPSQYRSLASDVKIEDRILLDDGNIELKVRSVEATEIECEVVSGGILSDHKGMNLPGVAVSAPALTDNDRKDAEFALDLGVDFLALSFVRQAAEIEQLREVVDGSGSRAAIVAKIEKPEALDHIDGILAASDAVMVARGELGVELPPHVVPTVQYQLIDRARAHRKPVIVATQMLESMIEHARPTRAEVTDVATAVRGGADAVMLSGETAAGRHPVAAVRIMDEIARQTEGYLWDQGAFGTLTKVQDPTPPLSVEDALSKSMAHLSRDLLVRAIVVISMHGRSLSVMSAARPAAPIIGICPDLHSRRVANLLWGVLPITAEAAQIESPLSFARAAVRDFRLVENEATILIVRGFSSDPEQNTPSVTIAAV